LERRGLHGNWSSAKTLELVLRKQGAGDFVLSRVVQRSPTVWGPVNTLDSLRNSSEIMAFVVVWKKSASLLRSLASLAEKGEEHFRCTPIEVFQCIAKSWGEQPLVQYRYSIVYGIANVTLDGLSGGPAQ
jgi:hypothetical protein